MSCTGGAACLVTMGVHSAASGPAGTASAGAMTRAALGASAMAMLRVASVESPTRDWGTLDTADAALSKPPAAAAPAADPHSITLQVRLQPASSRRQSMNTEGKHRGELLKVMPVYGLVQSTCLHGLMQLLRCMQSACVHPSEVLSGVPAC